MSSNLFLRRSHPDLPRSISLVMSALFTLAVAGYIAQSLVYGTSPPAPSSSPFPRASEAVLRNADAEWAGGPRECDLMKGISSSCLFLD